MGGSMSSVVISGDTSGAITLAAPAVAGTNTITLPATTGTVVLTGTTPTLNGIAFPATQSASADANTLDDYEEGTWTPTGNGITLSPVSGYYTKIGNVVTIWWQVAFPVTANTSGARIESLPFAVNANCYSGATAITNSGFAFCPMVGAGTSAIYFRDFNNTDYQNVTFSNKFHYGWATYFV
jgi:hypothetical protein